ncbi:MAG: hypothetical protein KGK08_08790 [Acidobacteriota bacterium]|nr:hypothetical protein [Acidobacteriota bacterium]
MPPAASQSPGVRGMGAADPLLQEDPERARIEAQQERLRVTERQKRMMTDADHLLALAGQLRAELVQPRTAESSAESARVAEEIEHLARNVKDRMRN